MTDKIYITYEQIHEDTKILFYKLKKINYTPDYIIAIGTGGFIPARIMKTFFNDIPIICMTVSNYSNKDTLEQITKEIQMIHKNTSEHYSIKDKNILVIDELDDTRSTLVYITNYLLTLQPKHITIGVLHNKIKMKLKSLDSSIQYLSAKYVKDKWIVYPWESRDLHIHNFLSKEDNNKEKHNKEIHI